MNPDENISLLIEQCKQQNTAAQFEIYKKFYKNMFNTAVRILNNKEEAEDVMQESFLKAFAELDSLNNPKAFAGWLKQLVIRSCLNAIQKNKKWTFTDFEENLNETTESVFDFEQLSENTEQKIKINNALQSIKPNYRVAITLHFIEGFDLDEMCSILNITNGNCRTLLSRAKTALRTKIVAHEQVI
ncbi:sigma-70 family RNA polymerase sigma factor [Flavobacterium agricola]|uniref:Sigma-70 family RNA polymerase sigma factor n=1 Tax=Flavobacterium agricola TaxID=2870839 RepID=A0ABY6M3S4_9FLAO|nr:sigma-70 family RNA polymerase sigma factor [Flavobacterium agricola]UYW02439.1 sigma-70 family RNA polymerase sigma factor [Flavobacterium agricola]